MGQIDGGNSTPLCVVMRAAAGAAGQSYHQTSKRSWLLSSRPKRSLGYLGYFAPRSAAGAGAFDYTVNADQVSLEVARQFKKPGSAIANHSHSPLFVWQTPERNSRRRRATSI